MEPELDADVVQHADESTTVSNHGARLGVDHVRIIGNGRAGGAFAQALTTVGVRVDVLGRHDLVTDAAADCDLVLICVPDGSIADVAAAVEPGAAVVGHCAGSRTLDVVSPHDRRCSIHPLMSLPDPTTGAERLLDGCHFAIAGDPIAADIVNRLGGHPMIVDDADRARYHATASIAANHLVALCAQVEQLAASLQIDAGAYWAMMTTTLDNVIAHGAAAALTGPAARGDWGTVAAHLAALPADHRERYLAMARAAAELAGRELPADLGVT